MIKPRKCHDLSGILTNKWRTCLWSKQSITCAYFNLNSSRTGIKILWTETVQHIHSFIHSFILPQANKNDNDRITGRYSKTDEATLIAELTQNSYQVAVTAIFLYCTEWTGLFIILFTTSYVPDKKLPLFLQYLWFLLTNFNSVFTVFIILYSAIQLFLLQACQ